MSVRRKRLNFDVIPEFEIQSLSAFQKDDGRFGHIMLDVEYDSDKPDTFRLTWLNRMTNQGSEISQLGPNNFEHVVFDHTSGVRRVISVRKYSTVPEIATVFILNLDVTRIPPDQRNLAQRQCIYWMRELYGRFTLHISPYARQNMRFINKSVALGPNKAETGTMVFLSPNGRVADVVVSGRSKTYSTNDIWYL